MEKEGKYHVIGKCDIKRNEGKKKDLKKKGREDKEKFKLFKYEIYIYTQEGPKKSKEVALGSQ